MPNCFISFKKQIGEGPLLAQFINDTLKKYHCSVYYWPERNSEDYRNEEIEFLNQTDYFIMVQTHEFVEDLLHPGSECLFELRMAMELLREKRIKGFIPYISSDFRWENSYSDPKTGKKYSNLEQIVREVFPNDFDMIRHTNGLTYHGVNARIQNEYDLITKVGLEYRGISPVSLKTLNVENIFLPPNQFQNPDEMIRELTENAFRNNRVHVISGDRGMGKTCLAQYFAEKCSKGELESRKDLDFENVIIKDYEEDGLSSTIEMLELDRDYDQSLGFDQKIQLLKELNDPKLLIIDNYDTDHFREELNARNNTYKDILGSGCYILITSRNDMSDCPGLSQTTIKPLPISILEDLFISMSGGRYKCNDPDLHTLIETYLLSNTYLVILTAKLAGGWNSVSDIIAAFEEHHMNEFSDEIYGRDQKRDTWFGHFKKLFDMSKIRNDESKLRILFNTMLLPPGGVKFEKYRELFAEPGDRFSRISFEDLTNGSWILRTEENEEDRVFMHPGFRELLETRKDIFRYEYIERYIQKLNKKLIFHAYGPGLMDVLKLGIEASESLSILEAEEPDIAHLNAKISSGYDLVNNNHSAYLYGVRAINILEKLKHEIQTDDERYEFANSYNLAGYAILHAQSEKNYLQISCDALMEKAGKMIEEIYDPVNAADHVKALYTINRGDRAAWYLANKEYQKGLELHQENIGFRKKWVEEPPSEEYPKMQRLRMLAASYTGVGTARYYLGMKDGISEDCKIDHLRESYNNHSLAVKYYREAYGKDYHIQIATAENRRAGALLLLMETDGFSTEERVEKGCEAVKNLVEAVTYISCGMAFPILRELADSVNKLTVIITKIRDIGGIDPKIIKIGEEAISAGVKRLSSQNK